MMAFFHGWRRKSGCITLMMACAFMAGWMRSLLICDVFNVPIGSENAITLSSIAGSIVCRAGWIGENPWDEFDWSERHTANLLDMDSPELPRSEYLYQYPLPTGEGDVVDWYLIGPGFGIGQSSSTDRYSRRCVYSIVPYWLIVISLTLLSAYLLRSKSTKPKSQPTHA